MKNIGLIGFGNMGEAFAAGLAGQGGVKFGVAEKAAARLAAAREKFGAEDFTGRPGDLLDFADFTIIAVKPQDAASVLEKIAPYSRDKKFAAIVAGKTLDFYLSRLQTPYVARFMPSLAAMYQKAVVGVSFPPAPEGREAEFADFRSQALEAAAAAGFALEIPESLMPVITAVSGSGLAFVFAFINALALGGVKTGLGYAEAAGLALRVTEGACEVLRRTGEAPSSLITKVASPAGTTIAGLQALEEAAFTAAVMRAVEEAASRAEELEGV
ncbi:MAG: NAD(P)-binding domain-containing protein [Spirochaetales bacterium]|jgi:pyrroline-5-carboxylate reductase|nr:NAD(P)-binding domain-containing protein [Spirochaetales bacterium]